MNDLPLPDQQPPHQAAQVSAPQAQAALSAADPKALLAQATTLVEAAVIRTASDPAARAKEIQAIKAAYQKARYGAGSYNDESETH